MDCTVHAKRPEKSQIPTWQKLRHPAPAQAQHLGDTMCWVYGGRKRKGDGKPETLQ